VHRRSILLAATVLATSFLVAGCKNPTPIGTILADPSHYEGQTVIVAGEVTETAGVMGFGMFGLKDESGEIPIIAQKGGSPKTGAKVGVSGTLRTAFTLGTESFTVILEERRFEP